MSLNKFDYVIVSFLKLTPKYSVLAFFFISDYGMSNYVLLYDIISSHRITSYHSTPNHTTP